ncbi:MAG TPA: NAD(P)H-quinone oxidoreductase [Rhizomicrobium sp.]|jgi:putative PIG3 family NAD(P)H quinone oxidoreductase|nr:NAD(P)H-quinone oxidoreductase [Rhizomicrobium sp.]
MKAVAIENPGPDYRLVLADMPTPTPGPGQVLIKVAAAGLNRADLLQARGLYPPPPGASPILGMEVSGEIAALGSDVRGFHAGERVCALLTGGGYAEYALADAGIILPVPQSVDLAAAAGLPEACFTAWTNVVDSGQLHPGKTLLVHGGTSGIGSMAIQIFSARGHRVFATAGSDDKCRACAALGADRAINYRSEDFVAVVKEQTGDQGVDVILDMVGGDYVRRNIEAAAVWGHIVNIAYQSGAKVEVDFIPVLTKRLTLAASTLRSRTPPEKRHIRNTLHEEVWPQLEGGGIRPVIARVFPLEQAQKAHETMAGGGHIGKILLSLAAPGG